MKKLIPLFLCFISTLAIAQRDIPPLWGHAVHDDAHVLSAQVIDELEVMLKANEDSTSNQLAVLIIPALDGEVLEDYSLRVAQTWKLGQQGKDNGVLLLVAVDDHKMRIEVGKGLEGVLPDVVASRIIRHEIAPAFRQQQYDEGVKAGVTAITKAIAGEYVATEDGADAGTTELTWGEKLGIGAFVFGILGIFTFVALFTDGCAGWFIYAFLIPFYAVFPSIVLGVNGGLALAGVYLIGFPLLKVMLAKTKFGKEIKKTFNNRRGGGGGWTSGGGWFGGSSGGWSSGGGGFSGGGGSFGGGGASGSW